MQSIHVCMISGNVLPNLIPALSDKNITGVITFSGDGKERTQVQLLKGLLEKKGIELLKSVRANSSFELPVLRKTAEELRDWLLKQAPDKRWIINLTAGTKLMMLALYDVFKNQPQAELVYQDTQSGMLRNIEEPERDSPNLSALDHLSYLAAQRFDVTKEGIGSADDEAHLAERRWIIDKLIMPNIYRIWMLTTLFNHTATQVDRSGKLKQSLNAKYKFSSQIEPVLTKMEEANLFTLDRQNRTITYADKEAAKFLGGGWLEEYVYWCARDAGIEHVGINVFGEWNMKDTERPTTNEFDVVLCHHNQLMVIECKALAFNDEAKGQDIVNKIEALGRKAGGLFGKSMLVASDKLEEDNKYTSHIVQRLKDYKIDMLHRKNLKNLTSTLVSWKQRCEPRGSTK